jgi:T5SS/PEP-CTERM-associated repeat protein
MLALVALPAAQAAVTVTGSYWLDPWDPATLNGPDLLRPGSRLFLASSSNATFEALAGAKVELAQLSLGQAGFTALALLDGPGTRMSLHSNGDGDRLDVGNTGVGRLTVSGGAMLDGRADAAACLLGAQHCNNFVGNGAGSDGMLTVTGAGSEVRLLHGFVVGNVTVNGSFGTAGATTRGRVDVLDGATMRSDELSAGVSWLGPNSNGLERSEAIINLNGANSFWEISGRALPGATANLVLADGPRATTVAHVGGGALWRVQPSVGSYATVLVGQNGGNGTLNVAASRIEVLAPVQSFFGVGRDGGTGVARFEAGSVLQMTAGRSDMQIGQGGGNGSLLLDNSRLEMGLNDTHMGVGIEGGTGLLSLKHGAEVGVGYAVFGRAGGMGSLQIESGARFISGSNADIGHGGSGHVLINSAGVLEAASLNMGGWGNGQGTAVLDGAASLIALSRIDGHRLSLGDWGKGSLVVSGGALLDAAGKAADCVNKWCGAMVGHAAGSQGLLTITGAGSEARFISGFSVGGTQVATTAIEGWTIGTVGGTGRGRVEVLDGGLLRTKEVSTGAWKSASANGQERSFAEGLVAGAGSRWLIHGSELEGHDARLMLASTANSYADWQVQGGGELLVIAPTGRNANVDLGNGGQATLAVQGAGSLLQVRGSFARLSGGLNGGRGDILVAEGGAVELQGEVYSDVLLGHSGSQGNLKVLSGGRLIAATLSTAFGLGQSSVLIDGAGSLVKLTNPAGTRLDLAQWGKGEMTISGGGKLDGRASACNATGWCGAFLGANAGANAKFTVTGAGSSASFASSLVIGQMGVPSQDVDGWTAGTPGAMTLAEVNVLDGGLLVADRVDLGGRAVGGGRLGTERSVSVANLRGPGSTWLITGGTYDGRHAYLQTSLDANAAAYMNISDGASLVLDAPAGRAANLVLSDGQGFSDFKVSGAGSTVRLKSDFGGWLYMAAGTGSANMSFAGGAQLLGAPNINLASNGGRANLVFDGVGSGAQAGGDANFLIGANDGVGSLTIGGGAHVDLLDLDSAFLRVGRGLSNGSKRGTGSLTIEGVGSRLNVQNQGLLSDGSGQAAGDLWVFIGDRGDGDLRVRQGGVMSLNNLAASTALDPRSTRLEIGRSFGASSGNGQASAIGAGSLLRVQGSDALVTVGYGANGNGQLQVMDQARLETTLLHIGSSGGNGQMRVDNAEVKLSGQWISEDNGAGMTIGRGLGSNGQAQLSNGAKLMISNLGDAGAGLSLGGNKRVEFGSGMLTVTGASLVKLVAAPGLAAVNIGRSGTGIASFDGASSLDAGDGSVFIGRKAGSVGVLTLAGNSILTAGYVGVGSEPGIDGGVGTLIVNDSTLSAGTLEIGAKGFVGGNGVLNANIINRGVFNPGNSPGTLTLGGDFANQAGGRLMLEVQANASGGFDVDQLIFADAASLDLSGLRIGFKFLGATDPNAFQASGGFRIDNFLQRSGGVGLDDALFSNVSFAASSDTYNFQSFSFTAAGGAVFVAQAVPEPTAWLMLLTGLTLLLQRRRYGPS